MPQERGYERQVRPSAAQGRALATPEVFGAGVGAAVSRLGEGVHRDRVRAYEIDRQATRDRELTEGTARVASYTVNLRPQLSKLKQDYPRGGAEYDKAVNDLLAAGRDTLFEGLTEQPVVQNLTRNLTDFDARAVADAQTFSLVAGAKGQSADAKQFRDTHVNGILLADDPASAFSDMMEQSGGLLGGLSLLDADQRTEIERELKAAGGAAWVQRVAPDDPAKAAALLREFGVAMTPQQVTAGLADIAVGIKRQEQVAKEAALAEERAGKEAQDAQRDINADIILRASKGDATAAEIAGALRRSGELGLDPKEVTELGYAVEATVQGSTFRAMTTPQLETEAERLRTRQRAGKLDAEDARRLERVDAAVDDRDDADGSNLSERFAVDPGGTMAALKTQQPARRVRLAEKIGKGLGTIAMLPAEAIPGALAGRSILSTRRVEFLPQDPQDKSKERSERMLRERFDAELGAIKFQLAGEVYGDKLDTALAIMAAGRNKAGKGYDPGAFSKAMLIAFGATERRDGRIQGGFARIGRGVTILPDNYTAREFDTALARADLKGATYDGTWAAQKADVRANFIPVWDPSLGAYRFTDNSGRSLVKADMTTFTWLPKGAR